MITIADEQWGKQVDAGQAKFNWKAISRDMLDVYAHALAVTIIAFVLL